MMKPGHCFMDNRLHGQQLPWMLGVLLERGEKALPGEAWHFAQHRYWCPVGVVLPGCVYSMGDDSIMSEFDWTFMLQSTTLTLCHFTIHLRWKELCGWYPPPFQSTPVNSSDTCSDPAAVAMSAAHFLYTFSSCFSFWYACFSCHSSLLLIKNAFARWDFWK